MEKIQKQKKYIYSFIAIISTVLLLVLAIHNATALDAPKHYKNLTSNGDGTYQLSLSVEGAVQTQKETAKANILVVYDVSNSMTNAASGIVNNVYLRNDTGRYGKIGNNYVSLYALNSNGTFGQITNDTTAGEVYYHDNSTDSYTKYEGIRYTFHSSTERGAAAENVIYYFAKDLYEYNNANADNVEMALVTFSNNTNTTGNSAHVVQSWTENESTYLNYFSHDGSTKKLNYSRGTNWEAGLQTSLNSVLSQADSDDTFVVFITDGSPTESGNDTWPSNDHESKYRAALGEAWDVNTYNTTTHSSNESNNNTTLYGIYAYGSANDNYLDDLIYYAYNHEERSYTGINGDVISGTKETDNYFSASSQEDLENALKSIHNDIIKTVGITNVSIDDGTTQNVKIDSGEVVNLLDIDENSFTYWMSKEVYLNTIDPDNGYKYYTTRINRDDETEIDVFFNENEDDNTKLDVYWVKNGQEHRITVTGTIGDKVDEETGETKTVTEVQWIPSSQGGHASELFFNQDPTPATTETDENGNSRVIWDLSSDGVLLDGVTYTVKFNVWKTQYVFDLIADLENKIVKYSDLKTGSGKQYAGLDKYIIGSGCDLAGDYCTSYRLNTNTDAKLKYTDTSINNDPIELTYDPPTGINIVSDTISIHKNWLSDLDDRDSDITSIDVNLLQDDTQYVTRSLTKENGWKNVRTTYIAPGLIVADHEDMKDSNGNIVYEEDGQTPKQVLTSTGTIDLKDQGHEYSFAELGSESYNWQLVSETVRPMVINGKLKELIKMDENALDQFTLSENPILGDAIKNEVQQMLDNPSLQYRYFPNSQDQYIRLNYKGESQLYLISDTLNPEIDAHNYRRSNLNIKKTVDGESANPNQEFDFAINVNDKSIKSSDTSDENDDLWFSVMDPDKNWVDLGDITGWTKLVGTDRTTGKTTYYYHAENNTPLNVKLKANYNLRFTNLTTETEYTITEENLPNGFKFDSDNSTVTGIYGAKYTKTNEDGTTEEVDTTEPLNLTEGTDYTVGNKTISGNITMTNSSYTVEMKNIYELANIDVTKTWEDNDDYDQIRPDSINVQVKQNGQNYGNVVTISDNNVNTNNSNEWDYTISKVTINGEEVSLPRFDEEGNEYTYTVEEATIDNYAKSNEENSETIGGKTTYTVTNTHIPKTSVSATKVWDDNDNQDGKRNDITFKLYKVVDGTETAVENAEEKTISKDATGNDLTVTWDDLFVFDDNNNEIEYKVKEETTIDGYETEVTGNMSDGFTITNSHAPEQTEVKATKVWDDNDNQDGMREDVTFKLYTVASDGTETAVENAEEKTISKDATGNDLTVTWTGLDKYKDGTLITYKVKEETTISGYEAEVTGNMSDGFTITNSHTPETIEVEATKVWDDNDNQDGMRENVTFKLYTVASDGTETAAENVDTKTISKDATGNDLTVTWTGLDKYKEGSLITYKVKEETTIDGYEAEVTGNMSDGFTITNSHTPEKTEVKATKVWDDNDNQDGMRENVTFKLYTVASDGTETAVENVDTKTISKDATGNDLTVTWTSLDKYKDGSLITYKVKEETTISGYETEVTGNMSDGFTITNTHTPEETEVKATKVWDDNDNQDGMRENVTFKLYTVASDGTETAVENAEEKTISKDATGNDLTVTWTGLDKYKDGTEIVYIVKEITEIDGYKTTSTSSATEENAFTITNSHTPEVTEVNATKVWNDNDNQDGMRENVTFKLYTVASDGTETAVANAEEKTISKDATGNDLTVTWTGLDKYKDGTELVYIVKEITELDGYETTSNSSATEENVFTITNTHTPEQTEVKATKVWDDNDNQDGMREDVTFKLYTVASDGAETAVANAEEKTISKDATGNDLTVTWTGLDKYKDGSLITYKVKEETTIDGYETEVTGNMSDGFTITNSHTPEKTEVKATKVWDDNDNQDGMRKDVTFKLYTVDSDGTETAVANAEEKTISKDATGNDLTVTWTGLDKYNEGSLITYKVKEETTISGYETEVTGNMSDGFTITNSHTPEKTEVSIKKIWNDGENEDGRRPNSLDVTLSNGTKVTLNSSNNWTETISNLPKYSNGTLIEYSWEEDTESLPDGYTQTGYVTDENNLTTITNTYIPGRTDIKITKKWNNTSESGIENIYGHNDSIEVKLSCTSSKTDYCTDSKYTYTLSENNNWTITENGLPKFRDGELLSYSVTELTTVNNYTSSQNIVQNISFDSTKNTYEVEIENTYNPDTKSIQGKKTWEDENNNDAERPTSITVNLYDSIHTEPIKSTDVTPDDWTYEFTNLPEKDNNGNIIKYYVDEVLDTDVYTKEVNEDNFDITNYHIPETVTFNVAKKWDDNNNIEGFRPTSITVNLLADGNKIDSLVLSENNNWNGIFNNNGKGYKKFKNINGEKTIIKYTIEEEPVEFYEKAIIESDENKTTETKTNENVKDDFTVPKVNTNSEYNITNKRIIEYISICGEKIWNDKNNADNIRPDFVNIKLFANGIYLKTFKIYKNDNWKYLITDLYKYQNGKEIIYSIEEELVNGYTPEYNGFNITNTHDVKEIQSPNVEKYYIEEMPPKTGVEETDNSIIMLILLLISILGFKSKSLLKA